MEKFQGENFQFTLTDYNNQNVAFLFQEEGPFFTKSNNIIVRSVISTLNHNEGMVNYYDHRLVFMGDKDNCVLVDMYLDEYENYEKGFLSARYFCNDYFSDFFSKINCK